MKKMSDWKIIGIILLFTFVILAIVEIIINYTAPMRSDLGRLLFGS